jgi:hypothetical protein
MCGGGVAIACFHPGKGVGLIPTPHSKIEVKMQVSEMKEMVSNDYGEAFYSALNSINKKAMHGNNYQFDLMTLITILLSVVSLLKDCNFKLPTRIGVFQRIRLTRVISRGMVKHNNEAMEEELQDAILRHYKSMVQEDLDQIVEGLRKTGKLVD